MERTVQRICVDQIQDFSTLPKGILIDLRNKADYEKGHIDRAVHADGRSLENLIMQLPKDTPLLFYCYHGQASLIQGKMFVDFGFLEIYSLNGGYHGWSSVYCKSRLQIWLEEQGYDHANSVFSNGMTPLMHAARLGNTGMVAELLLSGAQLDARNSDGNQALWFACFSENIDIMDLLIAAGIEINHRNDNGSTCLMYAASSGKDSVVKKLLEAGASVDLMNLDDFTALDMASSLECLNLLRPLNSSRKVQLIKTGSTGD